MDLKQAISLLNRVNGEEPHLPTLEPIALQLLETEDPVAAPAVIGCMERYGERGDFNLFQSLGHYLEEIDPEEMVGGEHLKALLLASLRRAPMWKTVELFHYVWFDEPEQRQVLPLLLRAPELQADEVALYAQLACDLGYRIVQVQHGWALATERVD